MRTLIVDSAQCAQNGKNWKKIITSINILLLLRNFQMCLIGINYNFWPVFQKLDREFPIFSTNEFCVKIENKPNKSEVRYIVFNYQHNQRGGAFFFLNTFDNRKKKSLQGIPYMNKNKGELRRTAPGAKKSPVSNIHLPPPPLKCGQK